MEAIEDMVFEKGYFAWRPHIPPADDRLVVQPYSAASTMNALYLVALALDVFVADQSRLTI
tara:strand:+ start:2404 stop:2586 length:183 start_codon:yes stop_codon:yes gene_type:complete